MREVSRPTAISGRCALAHGRWMYAPGGHAMEPSTVVADGPTQDGTLGFRCETRRVIQDISRGSPADLAGMCAVELIIEI